MSLRLTPKQLKALSEEREANRLSASVLAIRARGVARMMWVLTVYALKNGDWDSRDLLFLADQCSAATIAVDLTEAVEQLNSPFCRRQEPWERKYLGATVSAR